MSNCTSGARTDNMATNEFDPSVDLREQLFNEGLKGKITEIQVSTERIVRLRGILFDLDPKLFRVGPLIQDVPSTPAEFYSVVVRPMLERHEVLRCAEVRDSGTGLHVLLRFEPPVELNGDADRQRWCGILRVVQCALPIDPDQPHITAVTRPIESINGKNGAIVSLLNKGSPVPTSAVENLHEEMCGAPFKTVMTIMAGVAVLEPCPVCRKQGSRLTALDQIGRCYGSCGKVELNQLYDLVLAARPTKRAEGAAHVANSM